MNDSDRRNLIELVEKAVKYNNKVGNPEEFCGEHLSWVHPNWLRSRFVYL